MANARRRRFAGRVERLTATTKHLTFTGSIIGGHLVATLVGLLVLHAVGNGWAAAVSFTRKLFRS
jgi:hypothetical protein